MKTMILRMAAVAVLTMAAAVQAEADYKGRPESYNYTQGVQAMMDNKNDEAETYFQKELKDHPDNGYAYAWLMGIYREREEYGKMLDAAVKAEKYIPKKDTEYVSYVARGKAVLHMHFEDTIKAIETLNRAIKLVPDDKALYDLRASVYSDLKQWEKSDADYRHIIATSPGSQNGYYGMGSNAYARKQYAQAIDWFNQAIKVDGTEANAYAFRAVCHKELKRWDEATDDWCMALKLDNGERSSVYNILTLDEPAHSMMVAKLKVQARLERTNSMWPYWIAFTLEGHDHLLEAIDYYNKCNDISASPTSLYRISCCQEQLGRFNAALTTIERALAMEPDDKSYRAQKANLLYEMGRPQEAIKEFEALLDDEPEYGWGYYRCGWFKSIIGDLDGAIEDLTACIVLRPDYSYAYECRGDAYIKQGKIDLALADFHKVIDLEEEADNYECSHYAHLALGHREQAVAVMDTILSRGKNSKGDLYDAACLYSRMGDKYKALDYLEQSLEKGYRRFAHMRLDSDLDAIRTEPRYRELIERYDTPEPVDADEIKSQDELKGKEKTTAFGSCDTGALPSKSSGKDNIVPFTKTNGVCKVECAVNDLPLHFIFDTGAADVTISNVEAAFMYKNGYLNKRDFIGANYYMDANGDISEGTVINLRKVTFAGLELDNVRASVVHNQRAPLLLGQSVLGRLGQIEIDNSRQVIRIKPIH